MTRVSIRWRITLWNTAAFAVVLLGFGCLVYSLLRQTHYDQVDRTLHARYRELIDDRRLPDDLAERAGAWVARFSNQRELSAVVLDGAGSLVARSERAEEAAGSGLPALDADEVRYESLTLPNGAHVRRLTAPLPIADNSQTVVLLAELHHVDEELGLVVKTLLITAPITLGLAAALAYLLARKALAPVEQLRQLADEITAEHLDRRLPIHNRADELGLLAQTINSMIARLEHSFDEVRRFTADASHELRTPIAVIRSEAELGADARSDLEDARDRFRSILEECSHLASVTSQLLTLSLEDAGVTRSAREPVRLKPAILDAVESLRPLAAAKQQEVRAEADGDAAVVADPERLRQVFHNLIDNAIKYTPASGRITVGLDCRADEAVVAVHDTGIGIPAEQLPHVFERFYRVKGNGALDNGGAGLGLSIVHSIVSALGGRVEVHSTPGAGSVFRVYLPLAASGAAEHA